MSLLAAAGRTAMRWTVWARLLLVAEVALAAKRHLDLLDATEKRELRELVTKSRGRPSNLTGRERERLRALVAKIEPAALAKRAAGVAAIGRRR
jgi:hypothetical protein